MASSDDSDTLYFFGDENYCVVVGLKGGKYGTYHSAHANKFIGNVNHKTSPKAI